MKEQSKYQTMEDGMTKSYIWPLFNRISHILLVVFFTVCYILADFDELLPYHVAFGLALGVVFIFRIVWGYIGPKHSKFKDFSFNKVNLIEYITHPFSKTKEYVGHNPASSYAIVAMILLAFLSIISGLLTYGIEENHGVLSFLHSSYFKDMELFKEIHEFFSNLFLGVIIIHVLGSLIDKFIKKSDAIDSMISGYKKTTHNETIRTNIFQKILGIVFILATLFSMYYLLFTKENIFLANANIKQDYGVLNNDFAKECGSCHITYPPYLLPKESWGKMMANLENHFGDDASTDEDTTAYILAFLEDNSAQNSTHQAALKILKSLKGNNSTIAITKTPFWEKKHRDIDNTVFANAKIKSKANCKACHIDIENGLIENDLINMPNLRG
ncbi:MAG: cytochrome b/b6 domain-containing protein [Arcobacteraceae bacterium]